MIDAIEPHQADNNEVDSHDEIEQPRHQQDENTGDQGDKRRDMGGGNDHDILESFALSFGQKSEGSRNTL
jgi:hypothetical protein